MRSINQNIEQGETSFVGEGKFFLLAFADIPVDLAFYRRNSKIGAAEYVRTGFACWLDYDRVIIKTNDRQFITAFVSEQEVRYTPPGSTTTAASVADVAITLKYFEPDITDEELSALLLLVENWNMPTIDLVQALIDSLPAMVNETESII